MQQNTNNGRYTALETVSRTSGAGVRRHAPGYVDRVLEEQNGHLPGYSLSGFSRVAFFVTAGLLCIALAMVYSATYFGDNISRAGHSPSTEKLEIVVANHVLDVPANSVRFPSQRRTGDQRRLDLYLHWPSLSGYSDDLESEFNDVSEKSNLVFLTLEPRSMSFDMSGRIGPIYSIFFDGLAIREPNGLIRQPLSEAGGFIDEDMYYQPDNPYPFVARCVREGSSISSPFCLRDVHIGRELMVTYRFPKRFLDQWIELDEAIRNYSRGLLVNQNLAMAKQ
ncbi:MAG: hypothetical protein AAF412_07600 [Pseudomonadota bacterium]